MESIEQQSKKLTFIQLIMEQLCNFMFEEVPHILPTPLIDTA